MITIVDYGMGNVGSIKSMLKKIGVKSVISSDPQEINKAEKLILPGVGSFDEAMKRLNEKEIVSVLKSVHMCEEIPILGICLGMQLMTYWSEEGNAKGLELANAGTVKFEFKKNVLKVPHMGWNTVKIVERSKESELFKGIDNPRFYFAHSFYVDIHNFHFPPDEWNKFSISVGMTGKTFHGFNFCSAFEGYNLYGVQFHPEKSHKNGMKLLKNFAEL